MAKPSVLIVGGGVFGTSTAYHLSLRGYDSVTVLDRFSAPSKDSAATDLNKVVRADYPNPLYARLGEEAMREWKDPASIFAGMYRETGWVMSGHGMTRGWLHSALDTARRAGREGVAFMETEDMKKRWPALTGEFPDWTNLWSPAAGWVASGQAVLRMADAARAQGVKYVTGDSGYIKKLLYDSDGTCKGAVAADGTVHEAEIVVLATGANTAALVEASKEVVAQTSVICVMKLEPHEIEKYKDIPIIDDFEQGIIFPPDDNGLIKLCSVRLITNYQNNKVAGASVLHSLGDYPDDGCPKEVEDEMRSFVREIIPELADRPFISTKLCWDGIASDLNFRVCPYPGTRNLFVATVGSNHGFKFLPIIGKYVANMLEGSLGKDLQELWAWKNGQVPEGTQDPHPWPRRDLSDLSGWRGRNAPGAGKLPWTWSRL
ncbi:fructosyl amino acid oxidase [Colletotrichum plurivorum]|uniref:Fructosyl amino acid oxidase n=1 Tax=Colletotrichum plurivorum TaxID=2175906 RepID=A0A8H6N4D4_9PEZI|nr:fructosyl amino acid oxidase [Colletotrichum plurivorum]